MTPRRTHVVNYVLYQSGWIAAVGGAAIGWPLAGAVVALVLTAVHVALAREPARESTLVVAALIAGLLTERALIAAGTYTQLAGAPVGAWPPLWLIALWAQFATTWRYSLAGVFARWWRAALFGAAGGPLAFLAGARLGAVTLAVPETTALVGLGGAWAMALAALAVLAAVVGGGTPGRYRG